MTSSSTHDQHSVEHIRPFFVGLKLNASQAARVADVKRPVVATWASRHKDKGFPQAFPQTDDSRETLYDAWDFAQWASSRTYAYRTFEEMLVVAAVESSIAPCMQKKVDFQSAIQSLVTLVLAYRVVEPVADERPIALLNRCARVSPAVAKNLEALLLKLSPEHIKLLTCAAYAVAEFSGDVLGHVQMFSSLLMGRKSLGEQISTDLSSALQMVSAHISGDVKVCLGAGADSAVAIQIVQSLSMAQESHREVSVVTLGDEIEADHSFARALSLLSDEDLLLVPQGEAKQNDPVAVFVILPLSRSTFEREQQWGEIEDALYGAPVGVPVFVLGRSEVLGSAFAAEDSSSRKAVLAGGHLLALVECGQRQLVTESGARLMVGVFENHKVNESQKPLVALIDLAEKLGREHQESQEQAIHDIQSLLAENRQGAVHSGAGEHQLVRGIRARWEDIQGAGFDSLVESWVRASDSAGAVKRIEKNVEQVNGTSYEPFQLQWQVSPVSGVSTRTLKSVRDDGKLKRIAGVTAQKLGDFARVSADAGAIRVVDVDAMEHFRANGTLPQSYASLSAINLSDIETARDGDLLIAEGADPVVLPVRAETGLVVVKAPVFVLRRRLPQDFKPDFRLNVFAGLVQAALDAQIREGAAKASWGKARISSEMLNAVLGNVAHAHADHLESQLENMRQQKLMLMKQLHTLQSLENETLAGVADGSLQMYVK